MPYTIVNRLKTLMTRDFPSQLKSANPVLGKVPTNLPDDILDEIDAIADAARALFGRRCQPDHHQMGIMLREGFPVHAGKVECGIWHTGMIMTPKGFIVY